MGPETKKTTIARLNELLDRKDEELEGLRQENSDLDRQLRFGVDWMLHTHHRPSGDDLPLPRIELAAMDVTEHHQELQVSLVLPQRHGTHTKVPLAYSKRSGRLWDLDLFPAHGELSEAAVSQLPSLINDACFFMEKTGIPAYVLLGESHRYVVTSLRPLKLKVAIGDDGTAS